MIKTYYVSSGEINKTVQAVSPLEACKQVISESLAGDMLGRVMRVSDKAFEGDRNPWYVATEVVIEAVGHTLEKQP